MKKLLLCLVLILANIYFYRWTLTYKFNPQYWENYYYESQWNIPNSQRQIGDDGVYRYIGYRLVNGENPFNVDYWVPPFGKYLYGISAKYFNNPYLTSIFEYIVLSFVFYKLAKEFLDGPKLYFALILFHLNPFLIGEIGTTMLDLPLTLCLTTSLWFFIRYTKTKSNIFIQASFFMIGLAICTKPPYFVFSYIFTYLIYLLSKHQPGQIILFIPIITAGYIAGYFPTYFIYHPNPIPFIRLHQKIFDFQKNNLGSHNWQSIITYLLYGRFLGYWVNAKPIYPSDFSLVFPFGILSSIIQTFRGIRKAPPTSLLGVISTIYLIQLFFVDFWPRYLLPLIPIFTILISQHISAKPISLITAMIIFTSVSWAYFHTIVYPPQQKFIDQFNSYKNSNRYKDMYELLDKKSRRSLVLDDFLKKPTVEFYPISENNQWRMSLTNTDKY